MTDGDLAMVLSHARALTEAAEQLDQLRAERAGEVLRAQRQWRGPLADRFATWVDDEDRALVDQARRLRDEADAWARTWADTVNRINARRREEAVAEMRARRSLMEQAADWILGDESHQLVAPFRAVAVPTAAAGYAATGGLERYG